VGREFYIDFGEVRSNFDYFVLTSPFFSSEICGLILPEKLVFDVKNQFFHPL
jgi:hypothetical protein